MSVESKKEKVLIIEADAAFGERLVGALTLEGYQVFLEKDGPAGMRAIYDLMPHLILVDIVLPGIDGYHILEQKQAEPLLAKIPVFLVSTQGVPIDMQRIPQGAVKEFILDLHVDTTEIMKRISTLFGHPLSATKTAGPSGSAKKVLWVEDDKLIGTILSKKLINSGFDLMHAKDADEAFRYLASTIPDVIVLDLLIPGVSGFDILQKVRAVDQLKRIPVMILSNLNKQSDIERARILGAQKFLVKAAASLDQIVAEVRGMVS